MVLLIKIFNALFTCERKCAQLVRGQICQPNGTNLAALVIGEIIYQFLRVHATGVASANRLARVCLRKAAGLIDSSDNMKKS